ncbi:hypothetical protein CAOG_06175 [Capsaspora owczarzaki ATCC 30864]|uniref:Purple acid phosphatase n=1 Tax=Capsaspora owczarzaki (strain ATCC 30864) TaxID=595528 RepID=A0A0D2WTG5_CAPO3|nr:hypothetical protein CAOG_06175 [Capsaspora owczarzaki ATCC 30864]KJE95760.1 hypothetical protein CAOG_006175 [Capsaspora owczarzaki ATCC 30864]|eukprot:XP_004345765.1 hypothetical protein CAOG_06175 [Capsaspora owczarzaki ATCC 30864]
MFSRFSLLVLCATFACVAALPDQVHIAITGNPGERVVSWVTAYTADTIVQYGSSASALTQEAKGDETTYRTSTTLLARTLHLHDVLLSGLQLNSRYYYRVGDSVSGWSEVFYFDTKIDVPNTPVDIIIYGDMGVSNSNQTRDLLVDEIQAGFSSLIIHTGDFAYNMQDADGVVGDTFMNLIQPIAARVPYMVCVGNHENDGRNFSQYQARFNGISRYTATTKTNLYYSFNVNYVHFVAFSTEMYYNTNQTIAEQYAWLEADLAQAVANRDKQPWIVLFGHRPIYCSNVDDMPDCSSDARTLREGPYSIDNLLAKYNVDIFYSAHEHSYELTWPVSKGQWQEFPNPNVYVNPIYTVNIIAGAAGCPEDLSYFDSVFYGPWSNYRSASYGYGHFMAHNATHLHWTQNIAEGAEGTNDLWIIKGNATEVAEHAHNFGFPPSPAPVDECDEYCFATCSSVAHRQGKSVEETHTSCGASCNCDTRVSAGKGHEIGKKVRVERSRILRH